MQSLKDFEMLKKKLSNRRLDFDAKLTKAQKRGMKTAAIANSSIGASQADGTSSDESSKQLEMQAMGVSDSLLEAQQKYESTLEALQARMQTIQAEEERLDMSVAKFARDQREMFERCYAVLKELPEEVDVKAKRADQESGDVEGTSNSMQRLSLIGRAQEPLALKKSSSQESLTNNSNSNSNKKKESSKKTSKSASQSSVAAVPKIPSVLDESKEYVQAQYVFNGESDGELSLAKGDVLAVLDRSDPGWWMGELDGKVGIFPSNYVVPYSTASTASKASSKNALSSYEASSAEESSANEEVFHNAQGVQSPRLASSGSTAGGFSYISRDQLSGLNLRPINRSSSQEQQQPPSEESCSACRDCGCTEFSKGVFKPLQCNNCFHMH